MRFLRRIAIAGIGVLGALSIAAPSSSTAQTVTRSVIGNGATMISDGGSIVLYGTVGQPAVGVSGAEAGVISLYHGFWWLVSDSTTSVGNNPVAGERHLYNSPNPFTSNTTIHYRVNDRSQVRVRIYDATGSLVETLVDNVVASGDYRIGWDGTNSAGDPVASGYYYYTLDAEPVNGSGQSLHLREKMLLMQ